MNNMQIKNSGIWAIFWVLVCIWFSIGTLNTHMRGIENAIDRNGTALDKFTTDVEALLLKSNCHLQANVWVCDK